jgi:HEAT repeat protein
MAIAAILILSCGEKQPARIEHAIPEIPELYDCTPTAEIAESIAKSGECQSLETVSHLLRALDLQFTQDRLEAVDAAEALNDPCATEVLFRALGNRDQEVRVHAMVALGRPDGDLRAYELLCNILKNDKDGGIRLLAMHALCDLAGKHALGVFSAGVKDENFKVREESCRFIGYLGMPQSLDPLLMCRKDSHADVRYAAADAFAWLGEADLVIESLKDQDRRVRALAVDDADSGYGRHAHRGDT